MQEVFDHIDKVPDKEPLPKIPPGKKSKEKRDSPFSQLSGADEQIDLHGKTREEAIMIVQNFIKTCHAQGLRHVLIITGKGQHSGNRGPVLKTAVVQWLKKTDTPTCVNSVMLLHVLGFRGGLGGTQMNLRDVNFNRRMIRFPAAGCIWPGVLTG